jgi:hypothetical protein
VTVTAAFGGNTAALAVSTANWLAEELLVDAWANVRLAVPVFTSNFVCPFVPANNPVSSTAEDTFNKMTAAELALKLF